MLCTLICSVRFHLISVHGIRLLPMPGRFLVRLHTASFEVPDWSCEIDRVWMPASVVSWLFEPFIVTWLHVILFFKFKPQLQVSEQVAPLKCSCRCTFRRRTGRILEPAQLCDLLKGFILVVCVLMMDYIDVSMMYHIVRGQAIIKLYIFFNMLEVCFVPRFCRGLTFECNVYRQKRENSSPPFSCNRVSWVCSDNAGHRQAVFVVWTGHSRLTLLDCRRTTGS